MLALALSIGRLQNIIAHARHSVNVTSKAMSSPLAVVKWIEERKYKDLEQAIQRRFISTKQFGTGDEVEVRWGKAGRVWKVIYLGEKRRSQGSKYGSQIGKNKRLKET